jgi:YrhK-like protein
MTTGATARRRDLTTWTALGFVVGSALFAVGVPLSVNTSLSPVVGAAFFFVGSLFFTAAGFMQFLMSRRNLPERLGAQRLGAQRLGAERLGAQRAGASCRHAWFGSWLRPRTVDWTASAIQLAGTLWFNATTLRGLANAAGANHSATQVWRPDAYGSVAFLVSSGLAFAPEVRRRRHEHVRDRSWVIAALNLLGSVFFGLSAVGAWTDPSTDQLLSTWWANAGTVLGALCFLAGAVLLLGPRDQGSRAGRGRPPA